MTRQRSWGIASPIWNGLLEIWHWIIGLTWDIGLGNKSKVDEIIFDVHKDMRIPSTLIAYLRIKGYVTLDHLCSHASTLDGYWRDLGFFQLNGTWKYFWDAFITTLYRMGLRLSQKEDRLLWLHDPTGNVTARSAYHHIIS